MEEWKDIKGYEGIYQVSNHGNVRNIKRGKMLKAYDKDGYLRVDLYLNGKRKAWRVHRLVALAFIPNDDNSKDTVNHIDEDKYNNNVMNLEWMSRADNIRYSKRKKVNNA